MPTIATKTSNGQSWYFAAKINSEEGNTQQSPWQGNPSLPRKDSRTTWAAVSGGESSSWAPDSGPAWHSPAYCIVSSASTAFSFYEAAVLQIQAIQNAGFSTSIEAGVAAVSAELSAVYVLDERGHNRLAAQKIMLLIESKLRKNALVDANRVLTDADVSKLSSRSMIGLIRSTFRVKKQLPAWDKAYSKSWQQVRDSGKNPETLFIGLPRAEEVKVATAAK